MNERCDHLLFRHCRRSSDEKSLKLYHLSKLDGPQINGDRPVGAIRQRSDRFGRNFSKLPHRPWFILTHFRGERHLPFPNSSDFFSPRLQMLHLYRIKEAWTSLIISILWLMNCVHSSSPRWRDFFLFSRTTRTFSKMIYLSLGECQMQTNHKESVN